MILDVACPECTTEAVVVSAEQDGLSNGEPTYSLAVTEPCAACGHTLTPAEVEMAIDSARRFLRDDMPRRSAR